MRGGCPPPLPLSFLSTLDLYHRLGVEFGSCGYHFSSFTSQARSKRKHIPGEQDMDGVSMGIIRLHDTYRFNTSELVARGIFQTNDFTTQDETQGLTVWDAFKIGVKGRVM